MSEIEVEKWHLLEKWIRNEEVIPIIGPDALEVGVDWQGQILTGLFYRLVAEALLKEFQIAPSQAILGSTWALHKAVTEILGRKQASLSDIQLKVEFLIDQYARNAKPTECLRALLSIKTFSFFVSLTPDNILEKLLRQMSGHQEIRVIVYYPDAETKWLKSLESDVTFMRQGGRCIFQLLGSLSNKFALHDEDALEYLYQIQSNPVSSILEILKELRQRHLLLIGCNPPDWLGRAVIRLTNKDRLFKKEKQEFVCTCIDDESLRSFLSNYSPKSLILGGNLCDDIKKLAETFAGSAESPTTPPASSSPRGPTVFVSYANENAESAKRIADALLDLSFGDVWFDKKKLRLGDDWSDNIEEAIVRCDFFLPVLSAEADQGKSDRVFWKEWEIALKCANGKQAYLLPIGVDSDKKPSKDNHPMIAYRCPKFFDKHIHHAPRGALSEATLTDFKQLLEAFMNAESREPDND